MDLNEYLTKGNLTTFATWIGIFLYPFLVSYGIEIDQAVLTTLIYTLIVLIIAIISSANPNTIPWLGNDAPETEDYPNVSLNEDYEFGEE